MSYLKEILRVPQHKGKKFSLSSFDLENKERTGYSEGKLIVYKAFSHDDPRVILFGIFDNESLISSVVGYFDTFNGKKYFVVLDAYTHKDFRQKGYATALYSFLIMTLRLKLVSDTEQTPSGEKLWTSIRKVFPAKVYDSNTKKILPPGSVSDEEVYTTDETKNRYRFIIESESPIDGIGIPRIGEGIIKKHQFYTHPSKHGAYA